VDAIAQGTSGTTTAILVAEIEKREQDLQEVAGHILEAEARVQPLLLPKPAAVEDYLVGSATLFDGEFQRERELLEQVLDGIYIYADGDIVVQFKEAGLFEPVSSFTISKLEAGDRPLPRARQLIAMGVGCVDRMVEVARATDTPDFPDAKDVEVRVKENDHGTFDFLLYPRRVSGRLDEEPPAEKTVGVPNGIRNVTDRPGGRRCRAHTLPGLLGRMRPDPPVHCLASASRSGLLSLDRGRPARAHHPRPRSNGRQAVHSRHAAHGRYHSRPTCSRKE